MFCLNENNIYHLYSQGIDMRKGVEGLCGIIRTYQYSPTNQEVYVFANKSRTLVKMLHWERGGFVVYYKRLEQGRLSPSIFHHKNATAFIDIRWDEMVLLMEGIRLGIKRRKRYNIITPIRDKIAISCMLREIHEFSSHAIRHGLYIKNRKRLFCP